MSDFSVHLFQEPEIHSEQENIRSQIRELHGQHTQQNRELQRKGEKHSLCDKMHRTAPGKHFIFRLAALILSVQDIHIRPRV